MRRETKGKRDVLEDAFVTAKMERRKGRFIRAQPPVTKIILKGKEDVFANTTNTTNTTITT